MLVGKTSSNHSIEIPMPGEDVARFTELELIEVVAVCTYLQSYFAEKKDKALEKICETEISTITNHYGGELEFLKMRIKYGFGSVESFFDLGVRSALKEFSSVTLQTHFKK